MVQSASTSFIGATQPVRERIDAALGAYTEFNADCPPRLREAIRHSLLAPGKRLRPLLVIMAAEACGGSEQVAMPAACAVEMIHAYSLIHDDLPAMDNDDLRRGRPTCHKVYGEALAILAGDALLTLAFEVLARHIPSGMIAARCCACLAEAAGATALVAGQVDDLAGEFTAGDLKHLESIHRRKTGAMFLAALRLGGLVAEATNEQLIALEEYGTRLGLAFQIVDDLLDVAGTEQEMGKRVGKDSGSGKLTFPGLLGVKESTRRATSLIEDACEALAPLGSQASNLEALAHYVLKRNH